jgi:hypothetical protein
MTKVFHHAWLISKEAAITIINFVGLGNGKTKRML